MHCFHLILLNKVIDGCGNTCINNTVIILMIIYGSGVSFIIVKSYEVDKLYKFEQPQMLKKLFSTFMYFKS